MPESSLELKDISCSPSRYGLSPPGETSQRSLISPPGTRNPYSVLGGFCNQANMSECLSYLNQEMSSLGLPPLRVEPDGRTLDAVSALNGLHDLLRRHRRSLRTLEELEVEQLRSCSHMEHLQLGNTRMKDQLELSRRENSGLLERERQLQLKVKSLQNCLKSEKEEVQKHQSIVTSRATQYNHDMKRKEREFSKMKERLNQLLIDKREKKQAIEVLNYIGRSDGRRSLWKTGKSEARHEGAMYKTLLDDYDGRQRVLLTENAELKKVLQQMKREMVSILSSRKHGLQEERHEDNHEQPGSEDEDVPDLSRETLELSCEHAREKLTHSIRLQWRRLKTHVERLDSRASLVGASGDSVPRETHEEEMERLKLEIQQCRDFIHTQQLLLQQQLSSPCDEETGSLLRDGYVLEEKERLREEWRAFEEQRSSLETERRHFTEAAVRLGHERQTFEEDRASWLKHQFLNLTPFADQKNPQMLKSQSASSVRAEPEVRPATTPAKLNKSLSHMTISSPRAAQMKTLSTADLHNTLRLIPENSSNTVQPGSLQDSGIVRNKNVQHRHLNGAHEFSGEKNSSI